MMKKDQLEWERLKGRFQDLRGKLIITRTDCYFSSATILLYFVHLVHTDCIIICTGIKVTR